MNDTLLRIEQAVYGGHDVGGYRFLARSPGFLDAWLAEAERLCTGFGERPAGAACPAAVFARPFAARHVAVVQAADQGSDDAGRPGALAFRVLVLPRSLYAELGGDPFWIADHLPPDWAARGELPPLAWTAGPPPHPTVERLRAVLDSHADRTALLLGGAQALVDGGRLVFERAAPDPRLFRELWLLLPTATRAGLWPADFAFGNAHHFHALATPRASGPEHEHYLREAQAGDYPEGSYELALQTAVEAGSQHDLDALLSRRSRSQVLWLGVLLLLLFLLAGFLIALPLGTREPPPAPPPPPTGKPKPPPPADRLPPLPEAPRLSAAGRHAFAARLRALAGRLGVEMPPGEDEPSLADAVGRLDRALDARLPSARDPGDRLKEGPAQNRLRALLWKHDAAEFAVPGLNPVELLERLEKRLTERRVLKEGGGE